MTIVRFCRVSSSSACPHPPLAIQWVHLLTFPFIALLWCGMVISVPVGTYSLIQFVFFIIVVFPLNIQEIKTREEGLSFLCVESALKWRSFRLYFHYLPAFVITDGYCAAAFAGSSFTYDDRNHLGLYLRKRTKGHRARQRRGQTPQKLGVVVFFISLVGCGYLLVRVVHYWLLVGLFGYRDCRDRCCYTGLLSKGGHRRRGTG